MAETLHKHSVARDAYEGAKSGTLYTAGKGFLAGALGAATWTLPVAGLLAGAAALVALTPLVSATVLGLSAPASAALVVGGTFAGVAAAFGGLAGAAGGAVAGAAVGTGAGAGVAINHNRTVDSVEQAIGQQQQMNAQIQMKRSELQQRGTQAAAVVQAAHAQPHRHHHTMSNPALQAAAPQTVVANEMEHAGRVAGIERAASMA